MLRQPTRTWGAVLPGGNGRVSTLWPMHNRPNPVPTADGQPCLATAMPPDFLIGVCDESLNLFARITTRGAQEARRIQDNLADMDYESLSIGTSAQLQGCDLLMVRRPAPAPH